MIRKFNSAIFVIFTFFSLVMLSFLFGGCRDMSIENDDQISSVVSQNIENTVLDENSRMFVSEDERVSSPDNIFELDRLGFRNWIILRIFPANGAINFFSELDFVDRNTGQVDSSFNRLGCKIFLTQSMTEISISDKFNFQLDTSEFMKVFSKERVIKLFKMVLSERNLGDLGFATVEELWDAYSDEKEQISFAMEHFTSFDFKLRLNQVLENGSSLLLVYQVAQQKSGIPLGYMHLYVEEIDEVATIVSAQFNSEFPSKNTLPAEYRLLAPYHQVTSPPIR